MPATDLTTDSCIAQRPIIYSNWGNHVILQSILSSKPTSQDAKPRVQHGVQPPSIKKMWGVNPWLNPGFGLLRCGSCCVIERNPTPLCRTACGTSPMVGSKGIVSRDFGVLF
jgi:hypothetical protein